MSIASRAYDNPDADGSLPAFVERAQIDAQWQAGLARVGYRRIKTAYARQMREAPNDEVFRGLEPINIWPTMEFVRAWLKMEKRHVMARLRWTFACAMLATIVAVLTFMAALFYLG